MIGDIAMGKSSRDTLCSIINLYIIHILNGKYKDT